MNATLRCLLLAAGALLPLSVAAQQPHVAHSHQWVVPSRAVLAPAGVTPVQIVQVEARIHLMDRAASTELQFELYNPGGTQQEAVLLLPVPEGAAISSFAFDGPAAAPTATILPRDEARRLYDEITSRLRDPALLEFVDWRCVRSSVFPVPAGGRQRIRLRYEYLCEVDGNRIDYELPRSEMLTQQAPWSISVQVRCAHPIQLVYSPSHELVQRVSADGSRSLRIADGSRREPGAFRLGVVTGADPARPSATLFAYPDEAVGGGYFLLLASAPREAADARLRREVTLAIDRSGSMAGRKLDQAKAAVRQVLAGLEDGEAMQLIDYGNSVGKCFPQPVAKTAATLQQALAWLETVRPHGGTNLYDALREALQAPATPGALPLVLFLTDGIPTVGPTREGEFRTLVATGNANRRRVFCFGVGHDVNSPLLDHLAETTRAVTTYVQPEEDVEVRVASLFARLGAPVLAEPALQTVDAQGREVPRLAEVLPLRLPDLFAGDQLVVLGQYRGQDPLRFRLAGVTPSGSAQFGFTLPVAGATTRHAFVPRLWASRQIAFLVDELRQRGEPGQSLGATRVDVFAAPRARELRDEILRLSTRFGVLGEYTAFLAREGNDLGDWGALLTSCQMSLQDRAIDTRSGIGAVNQGDNLWAQKAQIRANYRNTFFDDEYRKVETSAVQQLGDQAFYKRGERWIDARCVLERQVAPDEVVAFGSPRYLELRQRLLAEGRAALLSLSGAVLIRIDGRNVLFTTGC